MWAQSYDPAKAKELFAQSGWTRPISILTTSSTNNWVLAIEKALVESLRANTGATVSFAKVASFAVLRSSARAGTVPIWLYGWTSGSASMPLGLARAYYMSDPEVRALVERGARSGTGTAAARSGLDCPHHFLLCALKTIPASGDWEFNGPARGTEAAGLAALQPLQESR